MLLVKERKTTPQDVNRKVSDVLPGVISDKSFSKLRNTAGCAACLAVMQKSTKLGEVALFFSIFPM